MKQKVVLLLRQNQIPSSFMKAILCLTFLSLGINISESISQGKSSSMDNMVYHPLVKSVRMYPETGIEGQEMQAAIISLQQNIPLLLEFDLLQEQAINLQARIIHCNQDWVKSNLNDMEFVYEFNEFNLNDYEYSVNTRQPYVNYLFEIPKLKVSGNYIVQVYQNSNPNDLLLAWRFVLYENLVSIRPNVLVSNSVQGRVKSQKVEMTIGYDRIPTNNPESEFKVSLRQNQRWDNAIGNVRPTRVDRTSRRLEYQPFQGETDFLAGNEFRFVDLRTYSYRGRFVANIERTITDLKAQVTIDKRRSSQAFSELRDMNGGFYLSTMEPAADYLMSDYLDTEFRLKVEPNLEPVYLIGKFNDWKRNEASRMTYDPNQGFYTCTFKLKQGIYDYQYYVEGYDPLMYEGSFFQTGNQYEVIVYYRSFRDIADRAVGYISFLTEL